jgi:hypothetical protein
MRKYQILFAYRSHPEDDADRESLLKSFFGKTWRPGEIER